MTQFPHMATVGRADLLCTRDEAFSANPVQKVCRDHGIRLLDDIALMGELRAFIDEQL